MSQIKQAKITQEKGEFQLVNSHPSIANCIRRTLLGEIPTLSFKAGDITFHTNTCNLHNEMIALRVSLIPVMIEDIRSFDLGHVFEINQTNETDEEFIVTSEHFTCFRESKKEDGISVVRTDKPSGWVRKLFPKDTSTGDFIPICHLSKGESIHIRATLSVGIGSSHAQFSPVCQAVYSNITDLSLAKEVLEKKIASSSSEDRDNVIAHFNNYQIERYYHKKEYSYPRIIEDKKEVIHAYHADQFQFNFESVGMFLPSFLFGECCRLIINKLHKISEDVKSLKGSIEIKPSEMVMKAFDFIFEGEGHSMGNLISSYLTRNYIEVENPTLTYVGYQCPHPLQKKMVLRISSCHHLGEEYTDLLHQERVTAYLLEALEKLSSEFISLHGQWFKILQLKEPSIGMRISSYSSFKEDDQRIGEGLGLGLGEGLGEGLGLGEGEGEGLGLGEGEGEKS